MEPTYGRNMASISNNTRTRVPDYASGAPISSTDNERSSHTAIPQSFGSATGWGGSIWNSNLTGVGAGFGSTVRDSSRHRENATYMNTSPEIMERKAGSGSLAPSESDGWNLNRTPWGDSNASNRRSSGVSPARRRSTAHVQSSQQYAENGASSYFPAQRQQTMGQGPVAKPAGSLLDPTSVNFSSTRAADSLTNGFSGFGGFGQTEASQRAEGTVGSWPDAASINSPTDDRRSATASEYGFGPSSAAQSRSGSLPPSRHGTELQFGQASEAYSRFGQPSRGPNSSFSQANGRALQERSGSIQSESNPLFGRMSIEHELDAASMHRASVSMNGLPPGTFAPSNNDSYARDSYTELQVTHSMGMRPEEAAYVQSGAYTPDSYMNGQLSEATLRLQSFQFDSRSAPNGSGVRQSPYYSQTHTPPVIDHLYPSRSDQSLANGNNIALVENKLQRLQQNQQDRRSFINSHQLPPHQFQHLIAANQFRHPYPPYQNFMHNNMGVNALSSNLAVSNIPGMMTMIETPNAPRDHDLGEGVGVMSKLLAEYKATCKTRRWELKEIYGHIVEFSGDQHGSRFIQQKLETANSEEKETVFRELQSNSLQLMADVFGNYVIQKFFEHGDQNQKRILANRMKGNVVHFSLNMYGCRVVQKALEHVLTDQQALLVKELENDVLKCVRDQNGNHVIQKAIERVPAEHIQFIIQAFKGHVGALAVHSYGCRVIQRMLEHCGEPSRTFILQELHAEGSKLISDCYGNYVTQHVIEHGGLEDRARVFEMVKAQFLLYSKHKFASNVVEKCLTFGSDAQRRELMLTIAEKPERGESTTMLLIKDPYGNYVLQKLLDTLCRKDYEEFVMLLRPEVDDAKRLGVNPKQVTSVEKKMHKNFDESVSDEAHPRTSISSATDISTASTLTPNTDGQSPGSNVLLIEATIPDKTVFNTSTTSKEFAVAVDARIAPAT